jgi:O-antigen ligase
MNRGKFHTSLYSFLTGAKFNLVGQLYGSELLSLLAFPIVKKKHIFLKYPVVLKVLFLYAILLASLMFSDLYNGTSSSDYLRGWASIIFSFISLFFLVVNFDKSTQNIVYFLFFYAISKLIFGESVELQSYGEENYFKAKIVGALNPLVLVFIYFLSLNKKTKLALFILFFYGLLNIVLDARSNSMSFFITFLLLLTKVNKIKINRKKLFVPVLLALMVSYGMYVFYVNKVLSGDIGGSNAKQLNLAKNPYNPFELLYYGRAGTFISLHAIKERPFLGYGSWVKDETGKYTLMMNSIMGVDTVREDVGYIPAHSILLTAWLWSGIIGFVAALCLYLLLIKLFLFVYKNEKRIYLLITITPLFVEMVWNFFFSPFGHLRETIPQIAAILVVCSKDFYLKNNKLKRIK